MSGSKSDAQMASDVMSLLSSVGGTYKAEPIKKDPRKKTKEEKLQTQQEIASKIAKNAISEPCEICKGPVYPAEKREVEMHSSLHVYHRTCFRCHECNLLLELNNYGSVNGLIYCKVHLRNHREEKLVTSSTPKSNPIGDKVKEKIKEISEVNKCSICDKVLYAAEKIEVEIREEKKQYHKSCFKCSVCGLSLNLRNYGSLDTVLFCLPHLKEQRPVQAQGAYFLSPLAVPTPAPTESYDQQQQLVSDTQNLSIESKSESDNSNASSITSNTSTSSTVTSDNSSDSSVQPVVASSVKEAQKTGLSEDELRRLEREERRRKREMERKLQEEEEEREAERRRKEREERRKRREAEAQAEP